MKFVVLLYCLMEPAKELEEKGSVFHPYRLLCDTHNTRAQSPHFCLEWGAAETVEGRIKALWDGKVREPFH